METAVENLFYHYNRLMGKKQRRQLDLLKPYLKLVYSGLS